MSRANSIFNICLISWVLMTMVGCSTPEQKVEKYVQKGHAHFASGDYAKATEDYKNALKINGKSNDALWGLVEIAEKQADLKKVYELSSLIVQQSPTYLKAQLKLGAIYLAADQQQSLQETMKALEALAPNHPDVLALKAAFQFKKGAYAEAVNLAQHAVQQQPGHIEALLVLISERVHQSDLTQALTYVNQGLKVHPNHSGLSMAKINILSRQQDWTQIENVLLSLIKTSEQAVGFRQLLAQFYLQRNDVPKAEAALRALIEADPKQTKAKLTLVSLVMKNQGTNAAKKLFEQFVQATPTDAELQFAFYAFNKQIGQSAAAEKILRDLTQQSQQLDTKHKAMVMLANDYLTQNKQHEGQLLIDQVLAEDPKMSEALMVKARIFLQEKRYDEAVASMRIAQANAPKNIRFRLELARAYELSSLKELAEEQYVQAMQLSHQAVQVAIPYAYFLVRTQQLDRAEQMLVPLMETAPNKLELAKVLAQIKIQKKDWSGALKLATLFQAQETTAWIYHQINGATYQAQKQFAAAAEAFKRAYQLSPEHQELRANIVTSYLQNGKQEDAIQFLNAEILANRQPLQAKNMLADIQSQRNPAEAVRLYRALIEEAPHQQSGYIGLYRVLSAQGDHAQARKVVEQGCKTAPELSELQFLLANLYQAEGNIDAAIAIYAKQIKLQPDHKLMVNNYVSLVSDHSKDNAVLADAYQRAQTLARSDNPVYLDTAGWIAFRMGRYQEAVKLLQTATKSMPTTGIFHFHLAQAYLAVLDKSNAKSSLDAALKFYQPHQGYTTQDVKHLVDQNQLASS